MSRAFFGFSTDLLEAGAFLLWENLPSMGPGVICVERAESYGRGCNGVGWLARGVRQPSRLRSSKVGEMNRLAFF